MEGLGEKGRYIDGESVRRKERGNITRPKTIRRGGRVKVTR